MPGISRPLRGLESREVAYFALRAQRKENRTMPERRTRAKLLRLHTAELDAITRRARECGRSAAAYIRETALGAVPKARPRLAEMEAVRQLARIGNNLNQLAHIANMNEELGPEEELRAVLEEVLAAARRLG